MKKYLYKIFYPIAKIYWFIFRPKTEGVKCIVEYNGKILMIRNTYANINEWTFPGGGIDKNETLENAIKREVLEETGITISNLNKLGEFFTNKEYKRDTVYCFSAVAENTVITKDSSEIEEARWFPINQIPISMTPSAVKILKMFNKN